MTEKKFAYICCFWVCGGLLGLFVHNWSIRKDGPVLTPIQYVNKLHESKLTERLHCRHLDPPFELYVECNVPQ